MPSRVPLLSIYELLLTKGDYHGAGLGIVRLLLLLLRLTRWWACPSRTWRMRGRARVVGALLVRCWCAVRAIVSKRRCATRCGVQADCVTPPSVLCRFLAPCCRG